MTCPGGDWTKIKEFPCDASQAYVRTLPAVRVAVGLLSACELPPEHDWIIWAHRLISYYYRHMCYN